MDFLGKLSPFSTLGFCTLNLDGKQDVKVSELAHLELACLSSTTHSAILSIRSDQPFREYFFLPLASPPPI